MRMSGSALFTAVLVSVGTLAQAQPITYNLSFAGVTDDGSKFGITPDPTPSNLFGTIVTDGTLGAINIDNILSWSWTQTGENSFNDFASDADISKSFETQCLGTHGCFTATANNLLFKFDSSTPDESFASFRGSLVHVDFFDFIQLRSPSIAVQGLSAFQHNVYTVTSDVVGVAQETSVPEPATLGLLGLGLAGIGILGRKKRNETLIARAR